MTLTEFVEARITELEVVARDALAPLGEGPRRDFYSTVGPHGDDWGLCTFHVPPARVFAECEAKRRIVQLHGNDWNPRGKCATCDEVGPCDTLRALALPYADHPDYDEAWRP